MANKRPPSRLEQRMGIEPEPWYKTAAPAQTGLTEGAGRDSTSERGVDLSLFPSTGNQPGQAPQVNPLATQQKQVLQIQQTLQKVIMQGQSLAQKQQLFQQGITDLSTTVQNLVQQGGMDRTAAGVILSQLEQVKQQVNQPTGPEQMGQPGEQGPPPGAPGQGMPPQGQPQQAGPPQGPPQPMLPQQGAPPPQAGPPGQPGQLPPPPAAGPPEPQPPSNPNVPQYPQSFSEQAPVDQGDQGYQPVNQLAQEPAPPPQGQPQAQPGQRFQGPGLGSLSAGAGTKRVTSTKGGPPTTGATYATPEMMPPTHVETYIKTSEEIPHVHIHPTELMEALLNNYGDEWFQWEPETIMQTLSQDFGFVPDDEAQNIIHALQVLGARGETFWGDPTVFEDTLLGLNGVTPDFGGVDDDLSPGQMVFGCYVAEEIAPGQPSAEVRMYTALRFFQAGMQLAMHPLTWAQPELNQVTAEYGDGAAVDPRVVQQRFLQVVNIPIAEAGLSSSDPIDQQVARLMTVRDYVNTQEEGRSPHDEDAVPEQAGGGPGEAPPQ